MPNSLRAYLVTMISEPFVALGLDGNLIQLIDFTCNLFSEAWPIRIASTEGLRNQCRIADYHPDIKGLTTRPRANVRYSLHEIPQLL